jgi:Zn-dependent protease with chaperone function
MHEKHVKNLQTFKTASSFVGVLGIFFLLFSIFVNGFNLALGLGIGLTASSVVLFLLGIFLGLMEEYTLASKRKTDMAQKSQLFTY